MTFWGFVYDGLMIILTSLLIVAIYKIYIESRKEGRGIPRSE